MEKQHFEIDGKQVEVYGCLEHNQPIIYLNTFERQNSIYQMVTERTNRKFSLVIIDKLNWNHDMSPWGIPPIAKDDTPCTGGANDYLRILVEKIIPAAERRIQGTPLWRGIVGYSLAGLFAVYSLYQTDLFARVASVSGSLWFPNIMEYIETHNFRRTPECVYFSLGDKERNTNNLFLKSVQYNTERIKAYYAAQGIVTAFVMNKGNHFQDAALRTAKGIIWMLENKTEECLHGRTDNQRD